MDDCNLNFDLVSVLLSALMTSKLKHISFAGNKLAVNSADVLALILGDPPEESTDDDEYQIKLPQQKRLSFFTKVYIFLENERNSIRKTLKTLRLGRNMLRVRISHIFQGLNF